jgi:hypothetical protein
MLDDLPLFQVPAGLHRGTGNSPYQDKLEADWEAAKAEQPDLMERMAELAREARRRGFERWSADALFHVMRWETGLSTGGELGLKVNNNHTALASRDLMALYPDLSGFFETRERKPRGNHGQLH